jgi:carbonic anhydrase
LDSIEDETERFNAFVEINAKEQVYDLSKTSIVQAAWKNGQDLSIHGFGLNRFCDRSKSQYQFK